MHTHTHIHTHKHTHTQGRIFRDPSLPTLSPAERRAIHIAMVTTLAQLHSINWEEAGLGGYGGRGERGDYCQRQVSVWSNNYKMAASSSGMSEDPAMKELMEWLPSNLPRGKQPLCKYKGQAFDQTLYGFIFSSSWL